MPSAISEQEPSLHNKQFFVNDGLLPSESIGLIRPTTLDTPMEEIRRRYKEDGHVLLKGILPREDVLKVRQRYFEMLAPTGFLAPGTEPVKGIFNTSQHRLNFPGIGAGTANTTDAEGHVTGPDPKIARMFGDLALQAHHEDWYKEDLCRHPALHDFIAKMTGWGDKTLSIRRTLLRNNTPQNKAIGVHYDQIFLRYGEDTVITAWVPIGDIKIDGGGLIYLEKGHDIGEKVEHDFPDRALAAGLTDEEMKNAYNQNMLGGGLLADGPAGFAKEHNRRWLLSEYEAGDVVLHNSYAIHASTINHDKDNVIRLGTDLRFVDSSRPWDTRWSNVLRAGDGL
ncbi:phytanoyl-CoA hydroxylase [Ilyonectria robusta]|uniref:phytanoyl-CoA hydroxylase n=1 Tax=Ilyonectria robusta TaxID=1079257 RepID=UPI001E8D17D2|nr:phytanoyl-CoA hydroxylase [Ilyonectria robusta]KAH8667778.1 phytanoyl-CoA hydroxylase [Ilyonectria robusta]